MPQANGFNGICMNALGVQFGTNIDQNHCQQYITDLKAATETFLNPETYGRMESEIGLAQGIKPVG